MAWEIVNCSNCGEEYRVQMYGPRRTREWKIENWSGVCDGCREKEAAQLLEENRSGDMPELTGSGKQIVWAMKIRKTYLRIFDEKIAACETVRDFGRLFGRAMDYRFKDTKATRERFDRARRKLSGMDDRGIKAFALAASDQVFANESAHWWIDNRHEDIERLVGYQMADLLDSGAGQTEADKALKADAEAEAVMMPENPVTETVADIRLKDDCIRISFKERRDRFREIVKDHGYTWDSPWKKELSYATGGSSDRVAEIAHALLTDGFPVRVMDPAIREKIAAADFEQEHTRWIAVLTKKTKHFYIQWRYADNMYDAAKKITGSRYHKPGVVVPMEQVDEVKDFADMYAYRFSPAAEKLVEQAEANKAAAVTVKPAAKEKTDLPAQPDGIPVLDVPENVEVHDDLKD